MNKSSSFAALVAAALIGSTTGTAWSDQATPEGSADLATQTPAPMHGYMPGRYRPYSRGPQYWPGPPRGYGQPPPYQRPRMPYRAAPPTPSSVPPTPPTPPAVTDAPAGAALTLAEEKLKERSAQLDMAQATLEQLHGKLQYSLEAERTLTEKLAHLDNELKTSHARITELADAMNSATATLQQYHQQIANDQQQNLVLTAERDRLLDELAGRDEELTRMKSVLQAATEALQQETATSGQQLGETRAQVEQLGNELTELKTRLVARKNSQLNTEQMLTAMIAERDGLQSDLATCSRKQNGIQADLAAALSEIDALPMAHSIPARDIAPPAAGIPVKVEPAAGMEPVEDAAEVVALNSADTDQDGIADSDDLCPGTQQGSGVDATGCEAGIAIRLEGVNFPYNSHELTGEAQSILERVAGIIKQQPDLRLEVAGHTDATGDPSYNQWLSMQRAEAVREFLVAQGVNPRHIGATGYGGQRPVADNDTLKGLQQNRRVELRRLP